jgi:chlorobactene glucosyltransferase
MILLGYILFAMLLLRFAVVTTNYFSKPYLPKADGLSSFPKVSILIPARNEEANLPNLLNDLVHLDYPNFEVIVCDDQSTDRTHEILAEFSTQFDALNYFINENLPSGWVGKNFACHQLAKQATGDFFLFLDADVRVKPHLLKCAMAYQQKHKTQLLSIFPEQLIGSPGEWRTVPLMNWILLTFLPLPLVRWKWFSSLSAANGQFMLFDAASYRENGWHKLVKSRNVEDILIAKTMKKKRLPIAVLLGNNDILCRMYPSGRQSIKGFALNIHQYFGGSRLWMLFYLALVWLRIPFLFVNQQFILAFTAIYLLFLMKWMSSTLSRQKAAKNIRLHVFQLVALTRIVYFNLKNKLNGSFEWKGREYKDTRF